MISSKEQALPLTAALPLFYSQRTAARTLADVTIEIRIVELLSYQWNNHLSAGIHRIYFQ